MGRGIDSEMCACYTGSVASSDRSSRSSPRTALFFHMPAKIVAKVLKGALERLDGSRCERTERIADSEKLRLKIQRLQILRHSSPLLHRQQNLLRPRQTAPTRSAPATRLLREEMLQVPHHPHRARLVVQNHHRSRA